ncbi:ATP-grasp domain-containing protein [Zhenhengia yiwuensis]|uniref:ATP-grasp domain-containing protein n=1 Tax=Zhenhengia yiwuensis TaxID=2763666 RepID=A0A926EDG2_9FIRM|nr:ATP-grasp domain-containing protein [Zhenhengia yiwuensis]MBC8578254.1 ATP-grasp domain-containing protein [Zhenhengia yiwuensis]MBS5799485.1 ATP-grasp domain-containing protein [Clostridiales bacterium]
MKQGLLIYKREDYRVNESYVAMLMEYGKKNQLYIQFVFYEDLQLGVDEDGLWMSHKGKRLEEVDFAINRSRESMLSKQLEFMGIRVFNSYEVTYLANHKGRTHQFISSLGIPSLKTSFFYPEFMKSEKVPFKYPFVIKAPEGHGGTEVFMVHTGDELQQILREYEHKEWILQEICSHVGEDVRVFVIGGKIIGAIRRYSQTDFRANYCLGGKIEWYDLREEQKKLVECILKHLPCDYVGIDFMIDGKGKFIFNELEDVVGSRSLYTLKRVDTAKLYIEHVAKSLGNKNV